MARIFASVAVRANLVDSNGDPLVPPGTGGALPVSNVAPVASQSNESTAAVTTSSSTILAANGARLNATVVNYGTSGCFLSLSGTATAGKGIYLAPSGGSYSIDATNLYMGPISAVTATLTTNLTVQEGQK